MRSLLALVLPLMLATSANAQDQKAGASAPDLALASAHAPSPTVPQLDMPPLPEAVGQGEDLESYEDLGTGIASYYGKELAGNRTANGETFDPSELTAAHRTLAFGSKVRVTNISNGESVVVRINDRGPFGHQKRVIDVSHAAAKEIGLHRSGIARVSIALLD